MWDFVKIDINLIKYNNEETTWDMCLTVIKNFFAFFSIIDREIFDIWLDI